MKHVILFGGSFDPIHNGHLNMALRALDERKADELWFIPNQVSPFKSDVTPFKNRFEMIELVLEIDSRFKVLDIEGKQEGPSYTIDTVLSIKKDHPDTKFDFLIGDDHIEFLEQWKNFKQLEKEIQFIVYGRNNIEHKYPQINGEIMNVSSSKIRLGESTESSSAVLRYIVEHSLYMHTILQNRLSTYRYEHVLRVCDLALELGKHHNLDLQRIKIAALWHDYAKEDKNLKEYIQKYLPECLDYPDAFYHAFVAADVLERHYKFYDKEVLEAIYYHVDGASDNDIAKVLYIADKCEPNRPFDTSKFINLAKNDLNLGFQELKKNQEEYLGGSNE